MQDTFVTCSNIAFSSAVDSALCSMVFICHLAGFVSSVTSSLKNGHMTSQGCSQDASYVCLKDSEANWTYLACLLDAMVKCKPSLCCSTAI